MPWKINISSLCWESNNISLAIPAELSHLTHLYAMFLTSASIHYGGIVSGCQTHLIATKLLSKFRLNMILEEYYNLSGGTKFQRLAVHNGSYTTDSHHLSKKECLIMWPFSYWKCSLDLSTIWSFYSYRSTCYLKLLLLFQIFRI
jgi:hypothetical protein